MGTPFEDYIGANMPLKGSLLQPVNCGGYDGDPNDPAAPAILVGAPPGTKYVETTAQRIWEKTVSGVWGDLSAVAQDIIPAAHLTYNLGDSAVAAQPAYLILRNLTPPYNSWTPSGALYIVVDGAPEFYAFVATGASLGTTEQAAVWINSRLGTGNHLDEVYAFAAAPDEIWIRTTAIGATHSIAIGPSTSGFVFGYELVVGSTTGVDSTGSDKAWLADQDWLPSVDGVHALGRPDAAATSPEVRVKVLSYPAFNWGNIGTRTPCRIYINGLAVVALTTSAIAPTAADVVVRWDGILATAGLAGIAEAYVIADDEVGVRLVAPVGTERWIVYPSNDFFFAITDATGYVISIGNNEPPYEILATPATTALRWKGVYALALELENARFFAANKDPSADGTVTVTDTSGWGGVIVGGVNAYSGGSAEVTRSGSFVDYSLAPFLCATGKATGAGSVFRSRNEANGGVMFSGGEATNGGLVDAYARPLAWGSLISVFGDADGAGAISLADAFYPGGFIQGATYVSGAAALASMLAASGCMVQGYPYSYGDGAESLMQGSGFGSSVFGTTYSFGAGTLTEIVATGGGAQAGGYPYSGASGFIAGIRATGQGARAGGYPNALSANGFMLASGNGSIAFGYCEDAGITASGSAAQAIGSAYSYAITAAGDSSIAMGMASTAAIICNGDGSQQFGQGQNDEDLCFGIGTGFRFLHLPDDTYTTPANGDHRIVGSQIELWSNGLPFLINNLNVTESGAARILSNADHHKTIYCTNIAGCTISVPNGLRADFVCMVVTRSAVVTTIQASGTATLVAPASAAVPVTTLEQNVFASISHTETADTYIAGGSLA